MKKGKLQCKDISDEAILRFLYSRDKGNEWCNWFDPKFTNSVMNAVDYNIISPQLMLSKMRQMIKKGLVDGCSCGCRGDFHLTLKGKEHIKNILEVMR